MGNELATVPTRRTVASVGLGEILQEHTDLVRRARRFLACTEARAIVQVEQSPRAPLRSRLNRELQAGGEPDQVQVVVIMRAQRKAEWEAGQEWIAGRRETMRRRADGRQAEAVLEMEGCIAPCGPGRCTITGK